MAWGRQRAWAATAVVAWAVLSSCGGSSTPLSEEGDRPPKLEGPATPVDPCDLMPAADASAVLGRPLQVVGVEFGAAQVPTYRCVLGRDFGVAEVTLEVAIGPIAENVFFGAYGDAAGGDPELVRKLGDYAYVRNEKDALSLHVYVSGSIVSLQVKADPIDPVERKDAVELATRVIDRVPANPQLAKTAAGPTCSRVKAAALAAVIGTKPSRASHLDGPGGSVMCTWASSPGSVTATLIESPSIVAEYRRTLDKNLYLDVDLGARPSLTAMSRLDRSGDLTVFDLGGSMLFVTVIPSAGFSDGKVVTTPAELELARSLIDALL